MLHYYGKIIMDIGFAVLVVGFFFFARICWAKIK
jgi:hypothetical protein